MTKEEIDQLYESNMSLYRDLVRSGEIYHDHHMHWDNASTTFNEEIESCCECDFVSFPTLERAKNAIRKVRYIAEKANYDGMGREIDSPEFAQRMLAHQILIALDGE